MAIDPDGLTVLAGIFGIAGLAIGGYGIILKRRIDQITRELQTAGDARNALKAGRAAREARDARAGIKRDAEIGAEKRNESLLHVTKAFLKAASSIGRSPVTQSKMTCVRHPRR